MPSILDYSKIISEIIVPNRGTILWYNVLRNKIWATRTLCTPKSSAESGNVGQSLVYLYGISYTYFWFWRDLLTYLPILKTSLWWLTNQSDHP